MHQTWRQRLAAKLRELNEIEVAYQSATWWEREEMKYQLDGIRREVDEAKAHIDDNTYRDKYEEVPW